MLRSFPAFLALLLSLTAALSAYGAQRTFVSTSGSDANTASNCSNTAPCRGFGAALTVTDTGGEIIVLTSGGYGPVTIDKSVSIIAPEGVYAGVSVFSGNGVTIATAGVDVVLRGLNVNRLGGTGHGINMTAGSSLAVQNCVISNFSAGNGLRVTGSTRVRLLDSLLRGNTYGAYFSDGPIVLISGSRFIGNAAGVYGAASGAGVSTKVDISRSEASSNVSGTGFGADGADGGLVELNVTDSVATRNAVGIYLGGASGSALGNVTRSEVSGNTGYGFWATGGGVRLVASANTITKNTYGLVQTSSAVLQSIGNNTVNDNITGNTAGTITALASM